MICFEGDHGSLESVLTKGYAVELKECQNFGERRVARRIVTNPEQGTTIEAKITALTELTQPDDQMFAVRESTPLANPITSPPNPQSKCCAALPFGVSGPIKISQCDDLKTNTPMISAM